VENLVGVLALLAEMSILIYADDLCSAYLYKRQYI